MKLRVLELFAGIGACSKALENIGEKVNSNTQLYKQAGNSIVVKVLEKIFSNLFYGVDKTEKNFI